MQDRPLDRLVAQVEEHLANNPDDGRGWEVVGPVYMRLGRFEDAVRRGAMRCGSTASAVRESDLGESLMVAANGVVDRRGEGGVRARACGSTRTIKARCSSSASPLSRRGNRQSGGDLARYAQRLRPHPLGPNRAPDDRAGRRDRSARSRQPAPGPSAEDVAAAQQMKPEHRDAMMRGMVERLAERLKQDGSDIEGWLRLVRAYAVLGERDKARAVRLPTRAARSAMRADKLRQLIELVKELGLEG